jgi:DNA polymerase-3 subunit beta
MQNQSTIFNIDKDTLLKALKDIQPLITSKSPELFIAISPNTIQLSNATMLERTHMLVTLNGIKTEGNDIVVAIQANSLLNLLSSINDKSIEVSVNEQYFTVQTADGKFNIGTLDILHLVSKAHEDPLNNPQIVEIAASTIQKGINKTRFAITNDILRPAMTGVLMKAQGCTISFVATDAHKIAICELPNHKNIQAELILPPTLLKLLKNKLPLLGDTAIKISYDDKAMRLNIGDNIEVYTQKIDKPYPDYKAVIPIDPPNTLTVNRRNLLYTINVLSIFANKQGKVAMKLDDSQLRLETGDTDTNHAQMKCRMESYVGEQMQILFLIKTLQKCIMQINGEKVQIKIQGIHRAVMITAAEQPSDDDAVMTIVLMPMMQNHCNY